MTSAAPRIAFAGQSTFFRACVPSGERYTFAEFREGADPKPMLTAIDAFAPDVVVMFRPETLPPGVLADVEAPVIGFLTEPVPRDAGGRPHPDLAKRRRDLERLDPRNVTRLVSFDPFIAPSVERIFPVWRSLPIPVADELFKPPRAGNGPPQLLFVGRSTPHRETFLRPVKRAFDLLHVAFGAGFAELARLQAEHDTSINLHNEPYPSFENRVLLALASGHLVITEPLSPTWDLVPGEDLLEAGSPDELLAILRGLLENPARFDPIRASGRMKAEAWRASTVFDGLARDALA